MESSLIFRRIHGRIVPILKKHGQGLASAALGGGIGAIYGSQFGKLVGGLKNKALHKKILPELKNKDVAAKHFVASTGIKNVTVITHPNQVAQHGLPHLFTHPAKVAAAGKNAFAAQYKKKDFIFASPKASSSILGHELGHIVDFRKNGKPGILNRLTGDITGATYRRETRAWDYSPAKTQRSRALALKTYQNNRDYTRRGAIIGGSLGAGGLFLFSQMK